MVSVRTDTTDGDGVHKAVDPGDGQVYVWTDFTPDYARYVWACFDQPDLKAPYVFTVTAPRDWLVLSNSGDPKVEDVGTARRWTFPATPPLSTYNTVINAGPYYEIRRSGAGHDLGLFARQSLASILERDADELFTLTTQGLEFFTDVFGMPFPQHKYDQVFAPDFAGAMENFGCVTWMDLFLRRSTPTRAEWDIFSRYLLHELAHMWFGNIVTMRWWDDVWLNEAFAEFASNWAAVRATSYTDAWTAHLAGEKLKAYLVDQGPTTHPIRQPVPDVAAAMATFDAITYPKGASVLQQLMTYIGEAEFSAGLTNYFAKHAWRNTTLQDLIEALAETSGRDLDEWRAGWLETAGTDRLTLEHDGDTSVLVAEGPGGPPRPQVLAVGAYRRQGDYLEREALVKVELTGERTRRVTGRRRPLSRQRRRPDICLDETGRHHQGRLLRKRRPPPDRDLQGSCHHDGLGHVDQWRGDRCRGGAVLDGSFGGRDVRIGDRALSQPGCRRGGAVEPIGGARRAGARSSRDVPQPRWRDGRQCRRRPRQRLG